MQRKIYTVLIVLILASAAFAQTRVKGTVTQDGKPVEGAKVLLEGAESKYDLKTNKKGEFFSLGIKPADYRLTVSKDGNTLYQSQVKADFDDTKNIYDIKVSAAEAGGQAPASAPQAAAPAPASGQAAQPPAIDPNKPIVLTEEQKKKLTPEQLKEYEEYQRRVQFNATVKNVNASLTQAKAANDAGNPDQAAQIVSAITQQTPTLALPWAVLGQYQLNAAKKTTDPAARQEKYAASASALEKAIQLVDSGADVKLKADVPNWKQVYANALEGAKRFDDSVKLFDEAGQSAAATDPKSAATAFYNAGLVSIKAGKSDQAVAYFDKAIAADPTKADAYYQKGIALSGKMTQDAKGNLTVPPGTEEAFEKYLQLAPTGPNAEAAKGQLAFLNQGKVKTNIKK